MLAALFRRPEKWVTPTAPGKPDTLHQDMPHEHEWTPALGDTFRELVDECRAHEGRGAPLDPLRILQFQHLLDIANRAPDGDYIELGVYMGTMSRVIWRLMDQSRHLYLLDTFEGFKAADIEVEHKIYQNNWTTGQFKPSVPDEVRAYVGGGTAPANVTAIKGWFPDSFAGLEEKSWRFVHIDFDLYQPIKSALDICWPRVVPGGVVVVHDYGCLGFKGVKVAVDEFFDSIGLTPLRLGDRWGSVAVVKPKASQQS